MKESRDLRLECYVTEPEAKKNSSICLQMKRYSILCAAVWKNPENFTL